MLFISHQFIVYRFYKILILIFMLSYAVSSSSISAITFNNNYHKICYRLYYCHSLSRSYLPPPPLSLFFNISSFDKRSTSGTSISREIRSAKLERIAHNQHKCESSSGSSTSRDGT